MDTVSYTLLFIIAAVAGWLGTYGVYRYHDDNIKDIEPRNRPILSMLLGVCAVITVTSTWLGVLTLRALAGFPPIEWARPFNLMLSGLVLMLPLIIYAVLRRVSRP